MVRESISFLRQQRHIEFPVETVEYSNDYDNTLHINVEVDQLQHLIDSLPEGYKMVFIMYAIEGYKHHEIASMLQITEGTSKSQLFKARKMLQEKLQELNKTSYGTK